MPKNILITGGSGFIGSELMARWLAEQHQLYVLTRKPDKLMSRWQQYSGQVHAFSRFSDLKATQLDWIINLSGEGIADRPWTSRRKQQLLDSRIDVTNQLASWLRHHEITVPVIISGSAIGIYGDCGLNSVDEGAVLAHQDFAASLCQQWEQSAMQLEGRCQRLVLVRTGIVLGKGGGMLKRLLLPFSLALGGRLGDGQQGFSWIHMEDYCRAIQHLLLNDQSSGVYNLVAGDEINNQQFTRALASVLRRPAFMHVPSLLLKTLLGELSGLLLTGQKVKPMRLKSEGFGFVYPDINVALRDLC